MSVESHFVDVLARHRADERAQALRALLMRPLMGPEDPALALVRRHAEVLRAWLARETGWELRVERGCARLYKRPATVNDPTRGLPEFDRQRYVLLCLVAAVLERGGEQITLATLGERVIQHAADPALETRGFEFSLERAQERRDLVRVCRFLLNLGVLRRVAGGEDGYVQGVGDALYDIRRRLLGTLLACARGPSTFSADEEPATLDARLAALVEIAVPDGEEARRGADRHALARSLLDDPVVYADELDRDTRRYFTNQRGAMAARLADATQLVPEQRAEGTALVDPTGELGDVRLPGEGTVAHATLLVAAFLAALVGDGEPVPVERVEAHLREAATQYGRYWRKQAREPGAERELAREALTGLHALRLVVLTDDGVVPRPALARYAVGAPEFRQPSLALA